MCKSFLCVLKKFMSALIDQPVLGSVFIMDAAILALHKPPFIFSVVMLGALIAMCMYFGQKLQPFTLSQAEPAEAEPVKQAD